MTSSGVLSVAVWICFAILIASGWRTPLFAAVTRSQVIIVGLSWLLLHNWTIALSYGNQINSAWVLWMVLAVFFLGQQSGGKLITVCGHVAMLAAIWMWLELLSRFSMQMSNSQTNIWLVAGIFSCYILLFTTNWQLQWIILTLGLTLGEALIHLRLHTLITAGEGQVQDVWWLSFLLVRLMSIMMVWMKERFLKGLLGSEQ